MILELQDVHIHYGGIHALKGVSFAVNEGEIVTLVGSNGAGKSTSVNGIIGLLRKTSGSIRFLGEDITAKSPHEIVRMGIGYAPEGRDVCAKLTVRENLDVGFFVRRSKEEKKKNLGFVYDLFPLLREREKQLAETLSGGEQQMLAIGRALMSSPRLLMLDEPSLGLAPSLVKTIFHLISQIRDLGVTVLLIEQNANMALKTADRGYVLETGNVLIEDRCENLLCNESVRKAYLGLL
jgi:branched-chain amino acid transport system ATP-binding protein